MKRLSLTCLLICSAIYCFSQTEVSLFKNNLLSHKNIAKTEFKDQFSKIDFSKLFTHSDNAIVLGFIGNNYQRIRIKLISITKDTTTPGTYRVYGKSMVKNNIDEFNGTIVISNILKLKQMHYGVDDEYKNKGLKGEYIILADYMFSENKDQPHSGQFKGICEADFYLDKNNIVHYDDIDLGSSDGFTNNQFIGQWTSYDGKLIQRCNWGDFRVPNSGDLDIGAGEFSPNDKYLKYGWQSVRDMNSKIENAKWWE